MGDAAALVVGGLVVAGLVLYFKNRRPAAGGCGCGCTGETEAPAYVDDDGPDSEDFLGGAIQRAELFARETFAATSGGCGCSK